jgi:hypothetical protein
MAVSTQTSRPQAVVETPTTPTVSNLSLPTANTEVSFLLTSVKKLELRARGTARLQYAYALAGSGTIYVTIPRGKVERIDGINFTGTIYIQASEGPETVEITQWV